MKFSWDRIIFIFSFASYCSCASLGRAENKPNAFGHGLTSSKNFQSWNDWMVKRGLSDVNGSPWDNAGEFNGDQYQQWVDWMYKRGFGAKGLGNIDRPMFQEWKDWMSKRGFGLGATFPHVGELDKGQFQQWSDWISKRGFNVPVEGFASTPGSGHNFQNWADFAKRQKFIFPSSGLSIADKPQFQNWQEWVKRMGSSNPSVFTSFSLGNKDNLMNWEDLYKKSSEKRQLGYVPDNFGSFHRYFTDGLQDWRSTFNGSKRNKEGESEQKAEEQ